MAANFQSPEMVAVVSSSLILSVMVLISFRMSSSSSFTGGDIEKVSSSVLGGDLQQGSSLRSQDVKMFLKYVEKKIEKILFRSTIDPIDLSMFYCVL